ncbi:endonuclease [Halobacteriovorax marinus]|uniref:GIY-YIG nuclease family protein n=1 Tax=Halobacteriovorax marinus TaxID=97084 RepID=UPI000BC2DE56|nr:GIY-YIG nuclease family protein [Halobacteriovorax marinus]ATH08929.1 endonuclease [Halobacteriovorax marinus]
MLWFVYILETTSGKFYTGITTDVERRFNEHASGKKGAKFFRSNRPKRVVHIEEYENRSLASKREWEIKQLSRKEKEHLIYSSMGPS